MPSIKIITAMSGLGISVCLFSFIATHLLSYGHQCRQIGTQASICLYFLDINRMHQSVAVSPLCGIVQQQLSTGTPDTINTSSAILICVISEYILASFYNVEIHANKSSLRQAKAHFYCILCGSLPAIHTWELAFLGIPLLSFSFLVPLSRFTSQESGLFSFRVAPLAQQSLTRI